ncbi:MAG: TetR/AcrR family transcriptional regulator [Actinomycetota bacterium]
MSSPTESSSSDGRNARRDTNILLALTTAQLMFDEDILVPSIEAVAERSGISARSLYRYFEDPQTLVRHAIEHAAEEAYNLMSIDNIGEGPLTKRIDEMVASRLRGYQYIAGSVRAAAAQQPAQSEFVQSLDNGLRLKLAQFRMQFERELSQVSAHERVLTSEACNTLLTMESIDMLHRRRGLSFDDIAELLSDARSKMLHRLNSAA